MKHFFLLLAMIIIAGFGYGVQPLRKPFIQIRVDGKSSKSGDVLTVKPGQKLLISVEMEGGRRDFCKFPEIYADIAGTSQIVARGKDGITYQKNGTNSEWKLLDEETSFSADDFLEVKKTDIQSTSEITVSEKKFTQSYLKIKVNTQWQFSQDGQIKNEENTAEGTLYFVVAGESNVWFSSQNIQATGIKNDSVWVKLNHIQLICDSIDRSFHRLNFSTVQQSIRDLQNSVNLLKSTMDDEISKNPSYQTTVLFIGLPSDDPFRDISLLPILKNYWTTFEPFVNDLKQQLNTISTEQSQESQKKLVSIITNYNRWLSQLPENTFPVFSSYIPDFNIENILLPENLNTVAKEKAVNDYPQTKGEMSAFLDFRIQQIPVEIQSINSVQTRLQAVRLFDGMLRSYFSSITWAEWKDTRQ